MDTVFAGKYPSLWGHWVGILAYTLQIYLRHIQIRDVFSVWNKHPLDKIDCRAQRIRPEKHPANHNHKQGIDVAAPRLSYVEPSQRVGIMNAGYRIGRSHGLHNASLPRPERVYGLRHVPPGAENRYRGDHR